MIKSILILISIQTFLFCSEQIVLVVSQDFNTSKAFLECYEDGQKACGTLEVNIGANGLGWGLGEVKLSQEETEPQKKEGDKKAPAGVFKLSKVFGYEKEDSLQKRETTFAMPYLYTDEALICVDDINSSLYNQIIHMRGDEGGSTLGVPRNAPKSFELMRRSDNQYELGIVVEHNDKGVKGGGSCIFMHVSKSEDAPTSGCTSMPLDEIKKIASWLNKSKNPVLIQIPKSSSDEILKLYPELKNSQLLN